MAPLARSTRFDANGNGCGSASVAPKKPTVGATHAAMVALFGLLVFLALRARTNRRARLGFIAVAATASLVFLPQGAKGKRSVAHAGETAQGHARARIVSTRTILEDGLLKTNYALATTICRTAACPRVGSGVAWGGSLGTVRQEVGGHYAPSAGDDVDVSFVKLPSPLAPLASPLATRERHEDSDGEVRVVTRAR